MGGLIRSSRLFCMTCVDASLYRHQRYKAWLIINCSHVDSVVKVPEFYLRLVSAGFVVVPNGPSLD